MRYFQTQNVHREHDLDDPKYRDFYSDGVTLIRKLYTDIPVSGKSGEWGKKKEGRRRNDWWTQDL